MKFDDVPGINDSKTIYFHNYLESELKEFLNDSMKEFTKCDDYVYFTDVELIRLFHLGNAIAFAYTEDDSKVILFDWDRINYTILFYNKNLFDFVKKQIMENINQKKNDELIIPKIDNLNLEKIPDDVMQAIKETFAYHYVKNRLS
ncbi:MAG: hypothetical protein MJ188_01080 [Treponema sp.]|nr:hypothetical protein [Treponema sp.]